MATSDFNSLLLKYGNLLKYFALSLTNDNEAAQDLLQDTLYKALANKDKFEESTNLKAWLYTIMKNTFINNYRRAARTNQIIDSSKDLSDDHVLTKIGFDSPETMIAFKDINREIDSLEEEFKIPFKRFFAGYKYKEIAEELDLPIGTVKSRIFLARKKLMEQLKDFT